MARVTFRRATLRDLELLVRHRRRMWEDMGLHTPGAIAAADAPYRRWARARLRSGKLVGWVAEARGQPVASGCVWLQEVQPRPRQAGRVQPYLLSMFTEPDHRGRGLATRIAREALRWCRARGYARLSLHASARGAPVYARLGFARTTEMRVDLRRRAKTSRPKRA